MSLSRNLLEAEKSLLKKYHCMLALMLSIPVAGLCAWVGAWLPQVHAEAQVAEREGNKDKMPKNQKASRDCCFEPLRCRAEAGQTLRVLLALPPRLPPSPPVGLEVGVRAAERSLVPGCEQQSHTLGMEAAACVN